MNNKWYLGSSAKSITIGSKLPPISKVVLQGDNAVEFSIGNDTGYVLNVYVPTATQQMAQNIFNATQGFEYQGYTATGAFISPAIELGDGVTVKDIYSIIAYREYSATPKMAETISAPYTEEDHEYPYEGTLEKKLDSKVELDKIYDDIRISEENGLEIIGTDGEFEKLSDILKQLSSDVSGVISFNERDGVVVPIAQDYQEFWQNDIREAIFESWQAEY